MLTFILPPLLAVFALLQAPLDNQEKPIPPAEKPEVRVVLHNGTIFDGKIASEDEEKVRLLVEFGEIIFRRDEIQEVKRIKELRVLPHEPLVENLTPPEEPKPIMGFTMPPAVPEKIQKEVIDQPPLVSPRESVKPSAIKAPGAHLSLPLVEEGSDKKLEGYLSHYLWFFPESSSSKFILGSGFFFLFMLLFWFSCRLAGMEDINSSRVITVSSVMFAILIVQAHLDVSSWAIALLYIAINLSVWFGLVKIVLKEPMLRGASVLAILVFIALVGVLASEVGYVIANQYEAGA